MSIVGGYCRAVDAAAELGMDCVQLFTKSSNQWRAKPLIDADVDLFQQALRRTKIRMPSAHDSYLINLASPDDVLWKKSLDAFVVELERAEALGLVGLVMHPGSYVASTESAGLKRIGKTLNAATRRTKGFQTEIWIENTAGQGTNLGWQFEQLAKLLDRLTRPERFGVCFDTCHAFAAGYGLKSSDEYAETMSTFDRLIGLERIRAFHLNDSKREQGSRVDRHAKIGAGELGLAPFRHLLNDRRFAGLPMYLETPKGVENGKSLDAINLATLRRLIRRPRRKAAGKRRDKRRRSVD